MTSYTSDPTSGTSRTRRSPLFGTTTFTSTNSGIPTSPSTYSYSYASTRSGSPRPQSEDGANSIANMRRIVVSPSSSPQTSTFDPYTYSDDDSIGDAAEVEAALSMADDADAEDGVTEWSSRGSSYTGPSYSGYSPSHIGSYSSFLSGSQTGSYLTGSYSNSASHTGSRLSPRLLSPTANIVSGDNRLSTITERTENLSRPNSYVQAGVNRNSGTVGEGVRRSGIPVSNHGRSATEPASERPSTPVKRTGELIAFFEEKKASGHTKNASIPSTAREHNSFTTSTSLPTLTTTGYSLGSSAYSYGSRPSSPTKSQTATSSSLLSPPLLRPRSGAGESRFGTSTYIGSQSTFTGTQNTYTDPSSFTGSQTYSGSFSTITGLTGVTGAQTSRTGTPNGYASTGTTSSNTQSTNNDTFTNTYTTSSDVTPTNASLRRPQTSPRSPLSSVRNIVTAWKERTPASSKKEGSDGLFSLRRRADRGSNRLRENAMRNIDHDRNPGEKRELMNGNAVATPRRSSGSLTTSAPFDVAELGNYANMRGSQEPLRIGLLWYLNVHAPPPYKWQRCQAVLYPHMLLLSWIAPGGGRGIVTLDLLNCTEVRSVPSPTHPSARDDIGTIAAITQSKNAERFVGDQLGDLGLMETLCPFQLLYSDGVERLGAESARERVRWVSAVWEALDRSVTIPDRSQTGSPTGSIRTMKSFTSSIKSSTSSKTGSGSGSASTVFVPPLDSIPDLSDMQSSSGTSSSSLTRQTSVASSHHMHAADDNAIANHTYLYPGDPRVIAPSRSSSIRRTSSLTDLDEEFTTAVRRARNAKPGLGFGLSLAGVPMGDGAPVTISSGSRQNGDVRLTPPPVSGRGRALRSGSESSTTHISDELFFSAGSGSNDSRNRVFSSSSVTSPDKVGRGLRSGETIIDIVSGSDTQIIPSSLSYRGPSSASLLGDSHEGSDSYSDSYSGTSFLARTREVVRRRRISSRNYSSTHRTEDSSDKENSVSDSGSHSYSGYTGTGFERSDFSTLDTYTYSGTTTSRSRTPARTYSSDNRSVLSDDRSALPSDDKSSTSAEDRTPSTASFASLPSIPSENSFKTVDECSTDYHTAEKCASDIGTDFSTAEICSTKPSTEFVTCDVCGSEASTEYGSAECRCGRRLTSTTRAASVISTPSTMQTISDESPHPEKIPLPSPTTGSRSPSSVLSSLPGLRELSSPGETIESSSISAPTPESSSSSSVSGPSSAEQSYGLSNPSTVSASISSPTVSDVTPSPSELTRSVSVEVDDPPAPPAPTPSFSITASPPAISVTGPSPQRPVRRSPSLHPSQWGEETDLSYESSILRASTLPSLAAPENPDISFDTSHLRPTVSQQTESLSSPSPYSETPTAMTSVTPSSLSVPSTLSALSAPSPPSRPFVLSPPSAPSAPSSSSSSSASGTPTPTSVSAPTAPSVSSKSVSIQASTLTRTPSSVSTVSSVSMSSSIFETESARGDDIIFDEPSTEPSLLSTGRSLSAFRPLSPRDVPLPRSPALSTPSGSGEVSITTPRGDVPSIHSQIRTTITEPPREITFDVDRLLQYLRDITAQRDDQHAEVIEQIRAIEDELLNFADLLHRPEEIPPEVPLKDQATSPLSRASPIGPRSPTGPSLRLPQPHLLAIPLTPPPKRLSSPSSLTSTMSFMSSHHSDDSTLYGVRSQREEQFVEQFVERRSPSLSSSWPSSEEDDTESYLSSELSVQEKSSDPPSSTTSSGEYLSRTSEERHSPLRVPAPLPMRVSVSPTPSAAESVRTVRESSTEQAALANLRALLEGLREQTAALAENQASTNQLLSELRGRSEDQGLQRVEDLLQQLLDKCEPRPSRETLDLAEETPSETSSGNVRRRLHEILRQRQEPPFTIHQPTPVRPSRADDLFQDLAPQMPMPTTASQPPPLIPFTYQPIPRPPRSVSPTADLPPRPPTEPILESEVIHRFPVTRPVGVHLRHQPRPTDALRTRRTPSEPAAAVGITDERPRQPTTTGTDTGPDFLQGVLDRRRERNREREPRTSGFYHGPTAMHGEIEERPVTAPPSDESPSWYPRRRPAQDDFGVAPPPVVSGVQQPQQPPNPLFVLPNDTAPSDSLLRDILDVMRDNRSFQMASVEQQNMLIDHLNRLNQWLTGDQQDRQAELRSVCARVDQLREDLNRLYQGQIPMPPQVVIPPVGSVQPPSSGIGGQQIPVPMPMPGGFPPPGFFPHPPGQTIIESPVVPTSQSSSGSSSASYSPVIPPLPPSVGAWTVEPPVVPDFTGRPPPRLDEPYEHRPPIRRDSDEGSPVIPPPPQLQPQQPQSPMQRIPPPRFPRPQTPSGSSSSAGSDSSRPHHIRMDVLPRRESRSSSPRSSSPRSSHTRAPTNIINVHPSQPSPRRYPEPLPPTVNVIPPSSSSQQDVARPLGHPPIIIQPPQMPMQQPLQVIREGRGRRRRSYSYSPTYSSYSSSRTPPRSHRRTPPIGPSITVVPGAPPPPSGHRSHRTHSGRTRTSRSPSPVHHAETPYVGLPPPVNPTYILHGDQRRTRSGSPSSRSSTHSHRPHVVVIPTDPSRRGRRERTYSRSPTPTTESYRRSRRRTHRPRYSQSLSYSSDPSYRERHHSRRRPYTERERSRTPRRDSDHTPMRSRSPRRGPRRIERDRSRSPRPRRDRDRESSRSRSPTSGRRRRRSRRSISESDVRSPSRPARFRSRDRERSLTPGRRRRSQEYEEYESESPPRRGHGRRPRYYSRSSTRSETPSSSRRDYPALVPGRAGTGGIPSEHDPTVIMPPEQYGRDTQYGPVSPRASQYEPPPGTPRVAPISEPPRMRTGTHIIPPGDLRDQIAEGDTTIPIYPTDPTERSITPPLPPPSAPPGTERPRGDRVPTGTPGAIPEEEDDDGTAVQVPPPHPAASRSLRARTVSGPRDLALPEGERIRQERFEELERHLHDVADAVNSSEDRREHAFRENEEARERVFTEAEERREREAVERRDQIWKDLEDRLNITPLPVPPPGSTHAAGEGEAATVPREDDAASIVASIKSAATRHAEEIMETVRLEREQMERERAEAAAERERMFAEARDERVRLEEEREARIRALEEELAQVKGELASERELRVNEETERHERERAENVERDENIRNQLGDITNLVQEQRDECARKKELMEERWADKAGRREHKDSQLSGLYDMINKIIEDRDAERVRLEDERIAAEARPGIEKVLEELARQNAEQRELLDQMAESWRNESMSNREETMKAIRDTAREQVPFNVQAYLDEFSKSLATEVRMLLNEVGKLREEKRNLQYELGCLMCMKSKYGPGGEFDPDWKPTTGPFAPRGPPPDDQPPPEAPPPPEPARPAWRTVQQRVSRKPKKPKEQAPPPEPEPRPNISSWATWQPDNRFVPTPPTVEPTLLVPPRGSPGLFGPRSPRDSLHQ